MVLVGIKEQYKGAFRAWEMNKIGSAKLGQSKQREIARQGFFVVCKSVVVPLSSTEIVAQI